jgi:hypothetical protein
MEFKSVVSIGPRTIGRMSPVTLSTIPLSKHPTRCEFQPVSGNFFTPFLSSPSLIPDTHTFPSSPLSPLSLSNSPTLVRLTSSQPPVVINVTPQRAHPPGIKIYESPHATMWLNPNGFNLPDPFSRSATMGRGEGTPDSSPLYHQTLPFPDPHQRSVSCQFPSSTQFIPPPNPSSPGSGSPLFSSGSQKPKIGPPKLKVVSSPSYLSPGLTDSPSPLSSLPPTNPVSRGGRINHRQSSDPFSSGFNLGHSPTSQIRVIHRSPSIDNCSQLLFPSMSFLEQSPLQSHSPLEMSMPDLNLLTPISLSRVSTDARGAIPSGYPDSCRDSPRSPLTSDSSEPSSLCDPLSLHRLLASGETSMVSSDDRSYPAPVISSDHRELTTLPDLGNLDPTQSPPDRVVAKYTDDLNIIKIHEAIMTRFAYQELEIPSLRAQIQTLHTLSPSEMTINQYRDLLETRQSHQSRLHDLENRTSFMTYISLTLPILKTYKLVSSDASKGIVSIRKIGQHAQTDPNIIAHRLQIIQQYLEIARDYIILDVIHINPTQARCPGCGIDFSLIPINEQSGLCICECGVERENLSNDTLYKDSTRVTIGNRNNYEDWENFEKALIRYQGRQLNKPPQKLYDQLDAYFLKIQKCLGSEIRSRPHLPDGKKSGTSRSMMLDALCETSNSSYYDDVNLIMNTYWGWKLPDVSHLESQIMQDYYLTQQIYNSEPHHGRDASLNTQFRLYVHLLSVGHPCARDDFKIQTSRDSLEFHQEIWKKMCEKTSVKFFPVI